MIGYEIKDEVSIPDNYKIHKNFSIRQHVQTAPRPSRPAVQWVQSSRSPAVKGIEREAEHSTPSGAQVTNAWYYLHSLKYLLDMVRNQLIN